MCTVAGLELTGFKSYQEHVCVRPLGPFTCVVGPNGCGKSVFGEAIAFALGGSKRMLRVQNLSSLINERVMRSNNPVAEVVLHLQQTPCPADDVGAGGGSRDQGLASSRTLSIKRVLTPKKNTAYVQLDSQGNFAPVSQAQLQELLEGYGIQSEAVDRYVVTQSRHAVEVQDPCRLLRHLELLIGTSRYSEQIEEQQQQLLALAQQMDVLQQEISSLEGTREALAPAVQHWRSVKQQQAALLSRRHKLLKEQVEVLQQHEDLQQQLVAHTEAQLQRHTAAAAAAADEAQAAQVALEDLQQQLTAASKQDKAGSKQATSLTSKVAAAELELQHLQAKQAAEAKLRSQLQDKLSAASSSSEACGERLQQLQQQMAEAQANLQDARQRAAAVAPAGDAGADTSSSKQEQPGQSAEVRSPEQQLQAAAITAAKEHSLKAQAAARAERHLQAASLLQQQLQEVQEQQEVQTALKQEVAELEQQGEAAAAARSAAMLRWQELDDQHRLLLAQLAEAEDGSHAAAAAGALGSSSGSRLNKYDAAVAALHQQLPGRFYGRMCNTAYISDASAGAAVAAALQETLNLSSTLITADREAAAAVVRHFQQQRVGRVTCRILQELPPAADLAVRAVHEPHQPPGGPQVQPLLSCVQPSSSCPEVQRLLQELLGRWTLVEDRSVAQQLLQGPKASRGRYGNLVTRAGEVFKMDGEVVAGACVAGGRGSSHDGCYALSSAVQPLPVAYTGQQQLLLHGDTAAIAVTARQQQQQQQEEAAARKVHLEQQVSQVAAQLSAAEADLQAAATQHAQLCQQLAAANNKLCKVTRSLAAAAGHSVSQGGLAAAGPAGASNVADPQQQLHHAWQRCDAAAGEAEAHQAAAAAADQTAAQLRRQLRDLHPAPDPTMGHGSSSSSATEEVAAAQAAYQGLQQQVAQAKQQHRRAVGRVAALTKELGKLEEAPSQHRASKLQEQLGRWRAALDAAVAQQAAASSAAAALQKQAAAAAKQLQDKQAAAERGLQAKANSKERLAAGQLTLSHVHTRLGQALEALQQLPSNPAVTAGAAAAAAGTADVDMVQSEEVAPVGAEARAGGAGVRAEGMTGATGAGRQPHVQLQLSRRKSERTGRACATKARSSKRQVVVDSSDEGSSDSGSDDEGEQAATELTVSRRRGLRGSKRQQHQRRHHKQQAPDRGPPQEESRLQQRLQQVVACEQQLDAAVEQLAAEEEGVAKAAARVQPAALEQDLAALKRLVAASKELLAAEEQHAAVAAAQEALAEERYSKLAAALQLVNTPLSNTYQTLTGGMGDAYCSYSLDRTSLFREGVQLYVRPDQGRWRGVASLSGGQQALVALALSFALQEVRPCPFCFLDEVDCALDTAAAGRVAQYVQQNSCRTQYLLVSHKPQVFEQAGCLVGVYGSANGHGSSAVVAQFGGAGASAGPAV